MAASFPGAIKSFSAVVNGVTKLVAALFNSPYDEITAIETELGTDPAGSAADLKTRLAVGMNNDGTLNLSNGCGSEILPIANGGTGVALTQRGRATLSDGGSVTYPTSFGDTNYTLIVTQESVAGTSGYLNSKSATGFTVYVASGSLVFNWLAIDDV